MAPKPATSFAPALAAIHDVTWYTLLDYRGMKRKIVLLLLTFGLGTNILGQVASPCQTGQNEARRIISSGSIYFPRIILESSFTLRKMVELDYGIKDEIYDNGTCLLEEDELECFYKLMKTEIENKWGKGFLKEQAKIASKLDEEGIGYIEPKENGAGDSIVQYLKMVYPLKINKAGYLVALRISPDKEIIDVRVLYGAPGRQRFPGITVTTYLSMKPFKKLTRFMNRDN